MPKLELYFPVRIFSVNQAFGLNGAPFYKTQGMKGHNGLDLTAFHGEPIYAAHDGIAYPEVDSAGGNGVVIKTTSQYEFEGKLTNFKTIYWHLMDADAVVHTGQLVKAGDIIGYADNTGNSTGDHLHFGLKPCAINETEGTWYNMEQNNGYYGAIDPMPYFNGKFAADIDGKYIFEKTLKYGMFNKDVKMLQLFLNKKYYAAGVMDGVFGPKTLDSVKRFQKDNKLKADGIVGPKTNKVINSLWNK